MILALSSNMIGIVFSGELDGFEAKLIKVEVDLSKGLPGWHMVGLPEKGVQESKERVGAALRNIGIQLEPRKTTINLAPAALKKRGNQYDLPMAIGLLKAHNLVQHDLQNLFFVGELSLTGELKPIHGSLLFSFLAKQQRFGAILLPAENAREAALVSQLTVIGCRNLVDVLDFLNKGVVPLSPSLNGARPAATKQPDFAEVKGQSFAKRALEIAAAGLHHAVMVGPPGSGKTMLAGRLPSILPKLTEKESMEVTKIYSALGLLPVDQPLINAAPFRAPHHSISYAGLVGGGSGSLSSGEITLAHNGVLFMDELPEFHRDCLQMLRQPIETGWIFIARSGQRRKLPARFQLIAAMNPCKCGYLGHPTRYCVCDPGKVLQYRDKISGPLFDRFDLQIEISSVTEEDLFENRATESSAEIFQRVLAARAKQARRFQKTAITCNGNMSHRQLEQFCALQPEIKAYFRDCFVKLQLSARAHDRILKVARTIADLGNSPEIEKHHIAEAIQFRSFDREGV
ncbi:MAG: YifB family Mg chelatase-like AAA ATPase [Deltaproteobacteria bacterium]|nr:YifB family Mg chelatase-like AAA ATPase [Deltaproteobacteria bacterium]